MENLEIKKHQSKRLIKDLNYLGINTCLRDLKQLPQYLKIFLIFGALVLTFLNFYSFKGFAIDLDSLTEAQQKLLNDVSNNLGSHFTPIIKYSNAYIFGSVIGAPSQGLAVATAIFYSMSGIAAFTGLLSIAMIVYGKMSQFLWGLVNGFFYCMFALVAGFIGDFIMNIVFILGASLGWYLFNYKHKKQFTVRGRSPMYKITFILATVFVVVLVSYLWSLAIPKIYEGTTGLIYNEQIGSGQLLFDAVGNGANLVGYGFQLMNVSEQFWIWMFLNIWKTIQYTPVSSSEWVWTLVIQYSIWTILASFGFWENQLKYLVVWLFPSLQKPKLQSNQT
ncbi:nicotinamide mononucleotide transporter family protein [Mesoplasma seiffertii]|uniref:nicotinamide mononucleotide transporter family protein n=1 Tax=Mesoplasma seiffertii TaxID=28224 RepID=UPI00047A8C25|nr:nicotinamide mononucleotide transporter family protein [Mesoplasma seiffertii]